MFRTSHCAGLKALALFILLPGAGMAAESIQTHDFSYSFTDFNNGASQSYTLVPNTGFVATFSPFDASLGTLISSTVDWSITFAFTGVAGAPTAAYSANIDGEYFVNGYIYGGNGSGGGGGAAEIGDVITSSITVPYSTFFLAAPPFVSDVNIYPAFVGTDPFSATWDAGAAGNDFTMNYISSGTLSAIGTATVTYAYEAIPEPAAAFLLLPAFGLLAARRRKRA